MAHAGGRVLLLARRRSQLEQVSAEIKAKGGQAWVYPVDISDAAAVEKTAEAILREIGVPDVLINNAGAGRWLPIDETTPDEAVQMTASPYFGAFYITRAFLPSMRRSNQGHLVNVTSPAGFVAWPNATAYTVARWAMRGFHEALRADLHKTRIRVTLVVPGAVASSYFAHNPGGEERFPGIARLFHTLTPEEVAEAIVHAVEREQREVIISFLHRQTLRLHRVWPSVLEWALLRTAVEATKTESRS
jgi:NADP-dependent 3-hydroxy acid dehydrogenase YdfG